MYKVGKQNKQFQKDNKQAQKGNKQTQKDNISQNSKNIKKIRKSISLARKLAIIKEMEWPEAKKRGWLKKVAVKYGVTSSNVKSYVDNKEKIRASYLKDKKASRV